MSKNRQYPTLQRNEYVSLRQIAENELELLKNAEKETSCSKPPQHRSHNACEPARLDIPLETATKGETQSWLPAQMHLAGPTMTIRAAMVWILGIVMDWVSRSSL